ncbi:hypothetical protein [Gorillibacterium sp. sgz5001074]|uniref:hypothetical protein n=1 Tax=Gorillibacterium sp. sgz5001074 TaxID=3446695 RepID=UPI003F670496
MTNRGLPNGHVPAGGQDWANYMGRAHTTDALLQGVVQLEGRLDPDVADRAVRLTMEAEPILGCRFVEHPAEPYWEPDLERQGWLRIEAGGNNAAEQLESVFTRRLEEGRMLEVTLVQASDGDALVIKLDHACCDGRGAGDYLRLLHRMYNRVLEEPGYQPGVGRIDRGDPTAVFRTWGIGDLRAAFHAHGMQPPTMAFPYRKAGSDGAVPRNARRTVKLSGLEQLRESLPGRPTMNDLLLSILFTAFYRHGLRTDEAEPAEILSTVDLRRWAPDGWAGTLCNLSSYIPVRIPKGLWGCFPELVSAVSRIMAAEKACRPGLQGALSMEMMHRGMTYASAKEALAKLRGRTEQQGRASPMWSNLGILSRTPWRFGQTAVSAAYLLTPAMRGPSFMAGASSYEDSLTWCVSYYEPERSSEEIERFMDLLEVAGLGE